ncbi:hypothetical protein GUJ93_ZPchr0005g16158 [Zizania palustris]|uniref:Uncharacterized protein n=1 Tax=Zizania palustris TaxID=103762 RepID=A0A8J5ST82_ZIZPA|nr:hypothetical protein GUJ93_ZPchr0005g16158 [Zizania palustris]
MPKVVELGAGGGQRRARGGGRLGSTVAGRTKGDGAGNRRGTARMGVPTVEAEAVAGGGSERLEVTAVGSGPRRNLVKRGNESENSLRKRWRGLKRDWIVREGGF